MPSLQSIALLAAATTASANYLSADYDAGLYELAARDEYSGDLLEDFDSLMQRDLEDSELLAREAKLSASRIGRGAAAGAEGFGRVGDGLTGISNIVGMFKGGKRDLEGYLDDSELLAREAKLSASRIGRGAAAGAEGFGRVGDGLTGISNIVGMFKGGKRDLEGSFDDELLAREAKFSASRIGHGAAAGAEGFGRVGDGLTGISNIVGMFKGGKSRRDLEDLYDESELFVREPRYTAAQVKGGLTSAAHGASAGASAFGHVGDGLTGISNFVNMVRGGKSRRDVDDLYDDMALYVREPRIPIKFPGSLSGGRGASLTSGLHSFAESVRSSPQGVQQIGSNLGRFGNGLADISGVIDGFRANSNSKRDLEDLLDAYDQIIAREDFGLEEEY